MNKLAAEKISQEYYTLGHELALDSFAKTAGLPKEVIKKLVQMPAAGAAGIGSAMAAKELGAITSPADLAALITATGAGSMAGSHLAGKGVEGLNNLITKLQLSRLRR